jgi:hypothetical protein
LVIEWTSPIPVWSDTYLPEMPTNSPTICVDIIDLVSDEEPLSVQPPSGSNASGPAAATLPSPALPPLVLPLAYKPPLPKRKFRQGFQDHPPASEQEPAPSLSATKLPPASSRVQPTEPFPESAWKPPLPRRRISRKKTPPPAPQQIAEASTPPLQGPIGTPSSRKVWSAEELHEVEPITIEFVKRFVIARSPPHTPVHKSILSVISTLLIHPYQHYQKHTLPLPSSPAVYSTHHPPPPFTPQHPSQQPSAARKSDKLSRF